MRWFKLGARFRGREALETDRAASRSRRGSASPLAGGGSGAPAAAQTGKASAFTGYAFDACNAPEDRRAHRLARLPLPRARHLHRRRQPRLLERPALARLDGGGRLDRLEPDPALRRPAGAVRRPAAASRRSRRRSPRARARPRPTTPTPTPTALGLGPGQPDLLRHGGLRAQRTRPARQAVQAFVTRLGRTSSTRSATSPASTGAPPRRSATCRRSPTTASAPDDVWIADWNGNESVFGRPVRLRHPLDEPPAAAPVPRRASRDLGRRHDRHRLELRRRRRRRLGAARCRSPAPPPARRLRVSPPPAR